MDVSHPAALEKLVLAAVEGALEAAKKMSADDMQAMMADMGLPNIPGL
jgi:DNA-binding protein YbaB